MIKKKNEKWDLYISNPDLDRLVIFEAYGESGNIRSIFMVSIPNDPQNLESSNTI